MNKLTSSPNKNTPLVTSSDNKYADKPIRIVEKATHNELWMMNYFNTPNEYDTNITDIVMGLADLDTTKELHIFISSYGGSTCGLEVLITMLERFEHIVTCAIGSIFSCGFLLWAMGDERYISSFVPVCHHARYYFTMFDVNANKAKTASDNMDATENLLHDATYIEEILTKEELEKGKLVDVFLTGGDLINRGVAIDFRCYPTRKPLITVDCVEINNTLFMKDEDGNYTKYNKSNKVLTHHELLKLHHAKKDDK